MRLLCGYHGDMTAAGSVEALVAGSRVNLKRKLVIEMQLQLLIWPYKAKKMN